MKIGTDSVDPFIGTDVAHLSQPSGLAASWWWPKPPVGNTHPGATYPFGMVSACAHSGAYPTGYGCYERSVEGVPGRRDEHLVASGFTHFQQSGTGAIRKYYNYLRVTPMLEPLDALGATWLITDETAGPGYYSATLDNGVRCELTVGPKSVVHRYTFPRHDDARIVIDCSHGGLGIEHGATVPLRATVNSIGHGIANGDVVMEGVPIGFHIECDTPEWTQAVWYDRRRMHGGTRLQFDSIRPTTIRPFGLLLAGPSDPDRAIEISIGFSLRGPEQARENLHADRTIDRAVERSTGAAQARNFDDRHANSQAAWSGHLAKIRVDTSSNERRTVFDTALYHSMIKPCFAPNESPFWPGTGPFAFDICTLWDIYRTQLPLLTALFPLRAVELANALLHVAEEEGNLPIGYRMAKGTDRFSRQGSALAHTFLADLCALDLPGIDWEWALCHMDADLRRQYGEEFLELGVTHPITHSLDLAFGYHCTAVVARAVGDETLAAQFESLATRWENAYDPSTGLLLDSTFYEGGKWNYSFRITHDMAGRIELAGGEAAYFEMLDRFFGFGAAPVKQLGESPDATEVAAGYALNRFEGLNNEPDMEAPWSYHYLGRPDRTADIVHAVVMNQFATGRGGLPGNDDSGGLSSWYVWASLGVFPVAGQQLFLVNSPSWERAHISVGDEGLTIDTSGFVEPSADGPAQYVQSAVLNGVPLERSWITAGELHHGGRLHIELGPGPSDWGTSSRPPSVSQPPHRDIHSAVRLETSP